MSMLGVLEMLFLRRRVARFKGLLKGSWDVVTEVITKVTILIITYSYL